MPPKPTKRNTTLKEPPRLAGRIEELLALIAKTLLAERLAEILEDKQHRLLYEKVGQIPVKELAKKTGLSTATISRLWQRWEQAGLLIKDGKQYRRVI